MRRALPSLLVGFLTACGNTVVYEERPTPEPGPGGEGGAAAGGQGGLSTGGGGAGGVGGMAPPLALEETPYGVMPPGTTVPVSIPPKTLGFVGVAEVGGAFQTVGFESVRAPGGDLLVSDFGIPETLNTFTWVGLATVGVPQTDHPEALPPSPGIFELTATGDADLTLSVWRRQTADGAFHGGVVDVNVFAVPGLAPESYITSVIEAAFDDYVGLSLGTLTFAPLDSDFTLIDETNFFSGLRETKGAAGKPALNVLAVGGFVGDLEGAAGVSPGAPAYHLVHGTHKSGIYWQVLGNPFYDKLVIQHESGHSAGLFHTTEFENGFGDALGDTPRCEDVLGLFEACPDYDNLMFPTGGSGLLLLSEQQRAVVYGSTLYRGVFEAGGAPVPPLDGDGADAPPPGGAPSPAPAAPISGAAGEPAPGWGARLPPAARALAVGLWCPLRGDLVATMDFPRRLALAAGNDAEALLATAADPSAPELVRMRAALAVGAAAPRPSTRAALGALVADARLPERVRFGALRGLSRAAPDEAKARARDLGLDGHPTLAAATRLVGR